MPKLEHRKSTTGCQRCKARKVKCDEARPRCGACARHQVLCEYLAPKPRSQHLSATPGSKHEHSTAIAPSSLDPSLAPTNAQQGASDLELRLFHYFLSHTRHGLRESDEFWGVRAPLIAFDHRSVFDAILAIAALHLYRQVQDNTFVFIRGSSANAWIFDDTFFGGHLPRNCYDAYLHYFDSAVKGQRDLMQKADLRAAYISASLISVISLVSLGVSPANGQASDLESADSRLWLNLAIGPRELIPLWSQRSGADALQEMGVFDDAPNFQDVDELFNPKHAVPFEGLLTFGAEFEAISDDERIAYQQALSYIGLIYSNLVGRLEEPLTTSRRFVALPSRVPPLFSEMVLQQRHRALAILAHAFAMMRLLEYDVPWYRGISARQVPAIAKQLPPAWQQAMEWPTAMLAVSPSEKYPLPDPASIEHRPAP